MQDLHQDLAALLVHRLRHLAVVGHVKNRTQCAAKGQQPALAIRRDAAGDDQPHTALGPLAKVGRQLGVVVETILQAGVHGAHASRGYAA